ncbi:DEAD/DEAH box helicase, partial [Actinotalea sp.]|uniref:Lhr family ATP-dependent helicase n=1 Tax=Actinotalea sp. TaxID=1872145 RepID=UPI00356604E9
MSSARPDPLDGFSAPTASWFAGAFAAPTAAQVGAWDAVRSGAHALVVAPTGSGKTLAAFLWSLDGLLTGEPVADPAARCRVVYVSPLKALASDVERNLRSPLVGIRQAARRAGLDVPEVRVGVRTGDTPPGERRSFATQPPDILITTPESLFLMLTSGARAGLVGVRTVIVDEIHAVAGTKRGSHLAVSLERLDALLAEHGGPAQRVGLSATVRPVEQVASFLSGARTPAEGGREVRIVQPPSTKEIRVDVVVPVPDLADLPASPGAAGPLGGDDASQVPADASPRQRASIWPHVEERVVDLVSAHRSTLVFTNSRRGAERLTARVNETWAGRLGLDLPEPGSLVPSEISAQSGAAVGLPADGATVLARAHHGSMSRAERTRTEAELKAGTLPAVVATSSLELGIDMGAVDLVVQVGAPPSVASGLQRIGRAGHQVGAISHGVMFPTFRGELVPAAVVAERMRAGEIERLEVPANPLDVLAQQVVAMVAIEDWTVDELAAVVRRAAPFTTLGRASLHAVLDMLAGRYPSEDFAELRPRLVWDRATGVLRGRPGAQRLAVTSGGTIPDRGLYGVFLMGADAAGTRGGTRVGELDEEMVYESRVGDTFTLGSSTWRIEEITHDQVRVSPAPGQPGRLPFWKGDSPGRPAELGRAIGAWVRETAALPAEQARARVAGAGLDPWAADNLVAYLTEQREATGQVPDDRTVVVERFRDEIGDWRVIVHSPHGARVHAPWALVLRARLAERYGLDAAVLHSDDGIVLRLPNVVESGEGTWDPALGEWSVADLPGLELTDLLLDPDEVHERVRAEVGGSALFAARFREAAARSLLLPRRRPDRRQPLWQQRQRSAQLLAVAAQHPQFPVLLEAARECLQDDFDVDALATLMREIANRRIRVVEVTTPSPSPFAQSLLFGYTAQFLYDGDAPLAERRAAALALDPELLAELLAGQASPLADLLDPDAVLAVEAEVSGRADGRRARGPEELADVVRRHGPLTGAAALERSTAADLAEVVDWLTALEEQRRVIRVRWAATEHWAAIEDAGRLRDALGVALPVGVPEEFTELVADPLGDLLRRHARTHGPFTTSEVAARFDLPLAVAAEVLGRLTAAGVLATGRIRPDSLGGTGADHCDAGVLRLLRRRSLAVLRAEAEPVPQEALGTFLPQWHQVEERRVEVPAGHGSQDPAPAPRLLAARNGVRGIDGLARVVEQLAGFPVPASALESLVLPARVSDYAPAMLDELTAAGEVLWAGHSALATRDGLVSLHPAVTADLTLPDEAPVPVDGIAAAVRAALDGGGAWFLEPLSQRVRADLDEEVPVAAVVDALWELVWAGVVTNDGIGPLRAHLGSGGRRSGTAHPVARSAP